MMAASLLCEFHAIIVTSTSLLMLSATVTGMAFFIVPAQTRIAFVALGIYLYIIAYCTHSLALSITRPCADSFLLLSAPAMGIVPFCYSAEAFPLYLRDLGMSFATATLWLLNFVVAFTFPRLLVAFKPQGAFGFYAAWNMAGFLMVLFFLPEVRI